ncbi:hypothetical protein [Candidatus Formimonas warabiya]|uniref:Methionine synthase n=1 Tax=Formimonas warabiya TaxID=1761012 RepID=A0A3G1KWU5_FORW1|nr:hypothetical protein [Candidatus Formimonas warabiya]ATW26867.1 hypothetical protein DCMF_20745 [Candidatus Formimonas warabiya]
MNFTPKGLATGMGSLPHQVPDEAVQFVFSYFPEVPYWPQLPNRGEAEGFLMQFMGPLLKTGLVVNRAGKYFLDTEDKDWTAKLTDFYELYLAALESDETALNFFSFPEESASGFYAYVRYLEQKGTGTAQYLKGQISGPLTVGLTLTDQNKKPVYYHPQGRDVLIKTLALQGLTQAKILKRFGLPVMIFVDDPSLSAAGQSSYITLKKEEIIPELNSIYQPIKEAGAVTGTHSCAAMDWSILLESGVDIVSFDAYTYFLSLTSYPDLIKSFMHRGGVFAWGIVPTVLEHLNDLSETNLWDRLQQDMDDLVKRGVDSKKLSEQSMITPSCGTGTLSMDLARQIHRLTRDLSKLWRGQ